MSLQYHLKIQEGDVAPYVLLPGDPKRVPIVASFWDEAHFVADNREHVTYTGVYKGVPISCTSTGHGLPVHCHRHGRAGPLRRQKLYPHRHLRHVPGLRQKGRYPDLRLRLPV